ncbi:MAG: hypothetical protein ACR2FM_05050 [Candidatus Saccharimonadales bacterium]
MRYYRVIDNQGCNFMDYSYDKPLTALEIRQIRWGDYKNNLEDPENPLPWKMFTLEFIADLWEIDFEEVTA